MNQRRRIVQLGDKLDRIVDTDLSKKRNRKWKGNFGDLVRSLIANFYNRPKLADDVKVGRPRKRKNDE